MHYRVGIHRTPPSKRMLSGETTAARCRVRLWTDSSRGELLEDGENTVLGSRWLDGQAREVAGKRREVANQDALEEIELLVARADCT